MEKGRVIARTNERTLYYAVMVNETGLREAERKQNESAERLSIIMENVNGGVSAIQIYDDGTSNIIFHNDKYYELFGYTREQAEAAHFDPLSCILPESYPYVMEKVRKLKSDGIPVIIDYAISKSDGSVAYIRANCALMEMAGYGKVIASVLVDVTEQRTLQDQLRAIVDNINGGVTAVRYKDGKPEFLLINDNYYDIVGYTKEQFETEAADVFDLVHPDDRERIKKLFAGATEQHMSYTMEYRILRRNGAVRHILCNTSIMHLFGVKEPVQLSVINDITALRRTQQKEHNLSVQMDTIMRNISGGITATVFQDKNHIEFVFANDGYYELYGYTKEQFEAEVPNVLDLILPEDRDRTMETVARIMREQESATYEYRCRCRDGSVIWTQTTNAVISMEGISDMVLLAVTTDITGLRRAEEESRRWADRLKAVMNAMTSGITAVTLNSSHIRFLFANDCYYQMHGIEHDGCRQDELREALEVVHHDDRGRVRNIILSTVEVGQSAEAEYRVNLPSGTPRYLKVKITVTNLFGIDEPVQVAIYSDITAEKKSRSQLRFLNELAHDIITEPDSDNAINVTLHKLVTYFRAERGYVVEVDAEKMQTSNTYEFCMDSIESQKENLQHVSFMVTDTWYQTLSRGELMTVPNVSTLGDDEYEFRERLSAQGIASLAVAPLMRDGKLIGFIGVDNPHEAAEQMGQLTAIADYVTILLNRRDMAKKIEHNTKTVQQLMDDTPGGFLRMEIFRDRAPAIVSVNDGFSRMLSMTREEIMKTYGNDAYSCLAPDDAAVASEKLMEASASGGQYTGRCRLLKKNGEYVWVMLFGRFVHGEKGRLFLNSYFTDITERQTEEENQKELLDNLPFGAAMYEFYGELISVIHINRKLWELIEREPVEYRGASVADMVHPDDRQILIQEILSAIRQNRGIFVDIRIQNGTGGYTPFHVTATAVCAADGRHLLYVCHDPISEEAMSLQEMLPIDTTTQMLAERKEIDLLDKLPFGAGMYEFDGQSLIVYHSNKQYEKMVKQSGYSSNTALLPLDCVHVEDRGIVVEEIRDAIASSRKASCVIRLLYGDSEYVPFRFEANIERENNGKYMLFVTYSRISAEEQSFENMLPYMFDTVMESSTDLAFAKDINFRYIRCSKTFADILGLVNEKNIIGKTDYELFPKEIADMFRRDDSALFADGKPQIDIDEAIPSPDGTLHYTRTSKHLLRDTAGNMIGIYCIGRDISEVREAFTQLKLLTNTIPGGIATFRCMPESIETIYFSDGVSRLAEYTREEYQSVKISPMNLVFDEDRSIINRQFELLMNGETTLEFTFRIHTKDGSYKWLNANAHATSRNGDVFTVSAVLTDVTESKEEKESLRRTKEEYRIAAGHSNRTICRYLIKEQELTVTQEASERLNIPEVLRNIPYGEENLARVAEETKQNYLQFYDGIMHGDKERSTCFRILLNNDWRWLDAHATTVFDDSSRPVSAIVSFADITEQREKEAIYSRWQNSLSERPDESYTLFRANLSKGVSFESRSGSLLDIDFSSSERSFDELTAEYIEKKVYADDRERYRAFLRSDTMLARYIRGQRSDSIEYRELMPDGTSRWLKLSVDLIKYPDSDDVEVYMMYEDIDERKKNELQTIERAETDALTGLLNRSAFAVRVNQIIGASDQGVHHALLMVDIDDFKQVNDIFGHGAGDEALTDIADLLTKAAQGEDVVGRLGGDEFLVFLPDITDRETAASKARKICEIIRKTFNIDVRISASIGIAVYPQDGEGFESLYRTADETLYRVKDAGKDGYSLSHEEPVTELEIHRGNIPSNQPAKTLLKQRRMLIVDDNRIDRTIISDFFKKEYIIEQAADGAAAVKIMRHYGTAISVMILDLMMPEMDGYEVLQKVQENDNTRTVPVIVVSSDDSHDTALRVVRAGATDLITKPIDPELLRIRVEAAISRAENERLRAQNSFLSLRNTQTGSYRAALEYSGIIVITLDWINVRFLYSPGIETRLAGKYDGRTFWRILLSDMVTDTQTVQKMQQLVHGLSTDRDRKNDGCKVRLKTPSGLSHMFDFHVFKENNDYGLADKMIITLRELNTNNG